MANASGPGPLMVYPHGYQMRLTSYNNDPNNHGGIVPAGGATIDGFTVPAGTWVAQFNDFGNDSILINGNNQGNVA